MKKLTFLAAAAAVLSLANSALAQTKVYIAGAPALRQQLTEAIQVLFASQPNVTRYYNGNNIIVANVVTWTNGTIGGQPVTIKLTYNGSAGGWKTNAASQNVRFIPDSLLTAAPGALVPDVPDVLSDLVPAAENAVPDFHISNEYQASTPWSGTNTVSNPPTVTTYAQLNEDFVGILPLRLAASPGAPFTNITPQLAYQLYTSTGGVPLSQFTGNESDNAKRVYALARGIDSGVRTLWATANSVGTSVNNKNYLPTVDRGAGQGLAGVVVNFPGAGYTNATTITIGGSTRGAGYTSAPTVGITGGGGSGAVATAVLGSGPTAGRVVSVTVNNGGTGYTSKPTVTFTGGGFTTAATVSGVSISGGAVTGIGVAGGATVSPVVSGGKITSVTVTNAGQGYTATPSATISTEGSSAAVTVVLTPGKVTSQTLYTAGSLLGITYPAGQGGYPTFGNLLTALLADGSGLAGGAGGYYFTVLSDSDFQAAKAGGTVEIAWNGNTLGTLGSYPTGGSGTASRAIANGLYDLWGYSRLAYRTGLSGTKLIAKDAIKNQLINTGAPIKLGDVNVQRDADGGPVFDGAFVP